MDQATFRGQVSKIALGLLRDQAFIPSKLLEERVGEPCMCTGAALLYAAHLARGGSCDVGSFFADLAVEKEDDFVVKRAHQYGLDPTDVRNIIINSKAIDESDRPKAVIGLVHAFAQDAI